MTVREARRHLSLEHETLTMWGTSSGIAGFANVSAARLGQKSQMFLLGREIRDQLFFVFSYYGQFSLLEGALQQRVCL